MDVDKLLFELGNLDTDFGLYPKAVQGYNDERDYTERDGFKNGWNAAICEYGTKFGEIVTRAQEAFNPEDQLFAALGDGVFFYSPGQNWHINLNDTWYYACADAEEIKPEHKEEVARLFRLYGDAGLLYWVYLQRKTLPDIPSARIAVEAIKALVEAREVERAERKRRQAEIQAAWDAKKG